MIRRILALCSRDAAHEVMLSRLDQALVTFHARELSWDHLVQEAEKQGISPLLYKHVCSLDNNKTPANIRRLLQSLYLRSRRSNTIRNRAVSDILNGFHLEKIDVLTVKGIALSNFVYNETGLRPMRDIDLLVKKIDIVKAEKILYELGYQPETNHNIPPDYYHLVPMCKTVDGLPVTIELHHNLLPFHPQYPLWPLEKSYSTALEFKINDTMARTLCLEDTLWYIYLHGFQAPLTYEPFRFIHVADIVSIVEKFLNTMDWRAIQEEIPSLFNIISRFHFLTPWQEEVTTLLKLDIENQPRDPGLPYKGWPKQKLATVKKTALLQLAQDTLSPSQWWVQVYYGHLKGAGYLKARLIDHPRTVWRWVKAYLYLYIKNVRGGQKKPE